MTSPASPFPNGEGIFETLRTEDGEIIELARHMRRAVKSAKALKISMPPEGEIRDRIAKVLALSHLPLGRLRICIAQDQLNISHDTYEEPLEGAFLTFHPHTSKLAGVQHKRYPYHDRLHIVEEAKNLGFDDAIVFDSSNQVTETGISNIAFLFENTWWTPPIGVGILPGVMRALAIEQCGVKVRDIHISEVPEAREIVLLGSLRIVQPVQQLGEMRLAQEAGKEFRAQMQGKLQRFSVG